MGQAESNPIRNMDKRTARREYRESFCNGIIEYKRNLDSNITSEEEQTLTWEDGAIRVCVRKRPIFKDELKLFEFDVISCNAGSSVIVHDCRMHSDMKRKFIKHHTFKFDRVFNEKCNNDIVYAESTAPLTQICLQGGFATCLMYGNKISYR